MKKTYKHNAHGTKALYSKHYTIYYTKGTIPILLLLTIQHIAVDNQCLLHVYWRLCI